MAKELLNDESLEKVAGGYEGMEEVLAPSVIQFVRRKVYQFRLDGYGRGQRV